MQFICWCVQASTQGLGHTCRCLVWLWRSEVVSSRSFHCRRHVIKLGWCNRWVTHGWSFLQIFYCGGFQIQWEIESIWQATLNLSLGYWCLLYLHYHMSTHLSICLSIVNPSFIFCISQVVKNTPANQEPQEPQVWSLGPEDPRKEEISTHSSILAWIIPWTEEPGRLQSMGLQSVRHDWECTHNNAFTPFLKYFYMIIINWSSRIDYGFFFKFCRQWDE